MIHNGEESELNRLRQTVEGLEEKLRGKRELLSAIVKCAPGIFLITNAAGYILKWNEQLERISGYSPEEIKKMRRIDFCAPEDRERLEARCQETLEHGSASAELTLLTKDGSRVPILACGQRFEQNKSVCIVGMAINVCCSHEDGVLPAKRALARQRISQLTEREKQVVQYVIAGTLNKVIASRMGVSTRSVEDWLREIRRKVGAENSAHLAAIAVLSEYPEFVEAIGSPGEEQPPKN